MKKLLTLFTVAVLAFTGANAFAAENPSVGKETKAAAAIERVNINKADAQTIASSLHRVGLKKAEAIVAWRNANGAFKSVDQLLEVKGIGAATIEANRERIQL